MPDQGVNPDLEVPGVSAEGLFTLIRPAQTHREWHTTINNMRRGLGLPWRWETEPSTLGP